MGRSIVPVKLTKEYILSKVSQITIFSVYFNLPTNIIEYCIDTGELILSPIREDVHPTCGFRYDNRGKLKFRDFAGYFWGDCFDAAALILSTISKNKIDISNKNDFIKVLRYITFTFKDIFYGTEKDSSVEKNIELSIQQIKKQKPIIELVIRNWNKQDKEYWGKFNIPIQLLNINFVYPIEQYYIDRKVNPEPKYYYKSEDPCYGYLLGVDRNNIKNIKLYFPNREHSATRFITNCNHLEGIYNLDRNDYNYIIITKSTKDRLSLSANLKLINSSSTGEISQINIGVINIPHETYHLRENEYNWLKDKLVDNGKLLSLMDNDKTGKYEAGWLRHNYSIIPLIIPNSYEAKDFSELVNKYTKAKIKQIIIETYKQIQNYVKNEEYIRTQKESLIKPF